MSTMTADARSLDVLHLDDDPRFVEAVAAILERECESLSVVTETRPRSALDRVESDEFDCLVVDYRMPGMTGLEFVSELRKREVELPFVLYTAEDSNELADRASAVGGEFVQKGTGVGEYERLADRVESIAVSKLTT